MFSGIFGDIFTLIVAAYSAVVSIEAAGIPGSTTKLQAAIEAINKMLADFIPASIFKVVPQSILSAIVTFLVNQAVAAANAKGLFQHSTSLSATSSPATSSSVSLPTS